MRNNRCRRSFATGLFLAAMSLCVIQLAAEAPVAAAQPAMDGEVAAQKGEPMANGSTFLADIFSYGETRRPQIDLNGPWEFRRDADGTGKAKGWHEGQGVFADTVAVPGAPQAQGFGEPTRTQRTFFSEPFWIRRVFALPELSRDKRVWLRIGAVLPAAEVYVNGTYIGYTQSSRTQQRIDITRAAKPGQDNLIAVRVCEFPEVRLDGLLEWNEGSAKWTGVYRPVFCEITDRVSAIDAYLQPRLATGSIHVDVTLSEAPAEPARLLLEVRDGPDRMGQASVALAAGDVEAAADVKLGNFIEWSPVHPKLYTLAISVDAGGATGPLDKVGIRFGMREISVSGTKFYLNGKPIFLRAYGEDHYYPHTLCPPADKAWYVERLKLARQYGLNATKGCVETIPQDYVEAADEAGILIVQEMPFGLSTLRANRHTLDERFRDYYASELDGLVRVSRNHASVVAYSMSSELLFDAQTQESFDFFSKELPGRTRELAPHALVIDCTGYVNTGDTAKGRRDTDFYASVHPKWIKEVLDETAMNTDREHPMILHEYNWWGCYPDPADREKYAGAQLLPYWLDALVNTARENGQEELLPLYRKNSLWLQALCRKDGVEYARRNPDVEGFILWLLIDFGQWSEGLLDDFWNPKNVTPEEFRQSNADTVVLLAEEGNRCLGMGGTARVPLAVSHYGEGRYSDCTLDWEVRRSGAVSSHGALEIAALSPGELTRAGDAEFDLPAADKAYGLELQVGLRHEGKVLNTNRWSFWVFPEVREELRQVYAAENAGKTLGDGTFLRLGSAQAGPIPDQASLVLADYVDEALGAYIEDGGRCLLFSRGAVIGSVRASHGIFRTIPWNRGDSGNLGTVISAHPAMEAFPHEGTCDLPFVGMMRGVLPMEFDPLIPYHVAPIIRGIDHYIANRNNAYMLEFRVGKGKVLATTLGILPNVPEHIEARYLLACLVDYAQGPRFEPIAEVPEAEFMALFSSRPQAGN